MTDMTGMRREIEEVEIEIEIEIVAATLVPLLGRTAARTVLTSEAILEIANKLFFFVPSLRSAGRSFFFLFGGSFQEVCRTNFCFSAPEGFKRRWVPPSFPCLPFSLDSEASGPLGAPLSEKTAFAEIGNERKIFFWTEPKIFFRTPDGRDNFRYLLRPTSDSAWSGLTATISRIILTTW